MAVPSFAAEVLADGPCGYWRMAEGSLAQPAVDSSPNHNDGKYQGGITLGLLGFGSPAFQAGDKAARFDGATGIVMVPNSPSLNPPSITMEAKIRQLGCKRSRRSRTLRR